MLSNIGGRDGPSAEPVAPSGAPPGRAASIGWRGYVGGALWMTFLCGAGLAAWLFFSRGG